MFYKIFRSVNKWILVSRPTNRHNWGFKAEGKDPAEVFKHLSGTGGFGHHQFYITIKGEG